MRVDGKPRFYNGVLNMISASMLYDYITCPHRTYMDMFSDIEDRDESNPFVELLWEHGNAFEKQVIESLDTSFLDLSSSGGDEKERLTTEAIEAREPLIYSGRISEGNLLGEPDILRLDATGYVAIDIKAGSGEESSGDERKPKKHYAVQLALYTDILERKGLSAARRAFVWDIKGEEVLYDFMEPYGKKDPRTLWQDYEEIMGAVTGILKEDNKTLPAYASSCGLCHWYTECVSALEEADDLTLIPSLGRAKRDVMFDTVATIRAFANSDLDGFLEGKKTIFSGIGIASLQKFQTRAKLISDNGAAFLTQNVALPEFDKELFFDIEVDPMRDCCYLHGFVERRGGDDATERFVYFFADNATPEAEKKAFADAWSYIQESQPCGIYYYSKYERTIYRKLQVKYPDVCTSEEIEALFNPNTSFDLYYDYVNKYTEWPSRGYGIKYLAKYLGFDWRDEHPSGAASIEWFHRFTETSDDAIKQRILDYNEDDCRATRVLLDGIRNLPITA